jgi:hypothetical protein
MTARASRHRSSRSRLTLLFLAVVLPPAVTLIWLGLRLLEQDHLLQVQREIEGRETSAETMVRLLTQAVAEMENRSAAGEWREGTLHVIATASGPRYDPPGRLLWTDRVLELPEAAATPFGAAETAEFQGSPESALHVYRELSASNDEAVRAGALLRAARVERKQRHIEQALSYYRALVDLPRIAINGTPADLLAPRDLRAPAK